MEHNLKEIITILNYTANILKSTTMENLQRSILKFLEQMNKAESDNKFDIESLLLSK